ncbi:uncharacterized protein LOC116163225 isoform X1 [Photinus pyralis]|uniref:uncharacterized protein LOC116163225 isoform X1 n=1 Tax=Photinus pyralis TaxID=7054 RepID=UPI0012670E63|nr:uncharacterized protein LOC116163225 isoform X1 [Photinus pyralis]
MPKARKSFTTKKRSRKVILQKAREAKLTKMAMNVVSSIEEDDKPNCMVQCEEHLSDVNHEAGSGTNDEDEHGSEMSFYESDLETEPHCEQKDTLFLSGRRIVEIGHFLASLRALRHDGFGCSFFDMDIQSEKIEGLESIFTFKCKVCGKIDSVRSCGGSATFHSTNQAGIIGSLSIGIGYSQLAELLAAMDIPQMSNVTYLKNHNAIYPSVHALNQQLMTVAAKEEAELADEMKDGIPVIGVIADGAWAKRSYRKNYSALSGVASIIGAKTKKILHMGVKNKYCFLCARGRKEEDHDCFRNWSKTSRAMESAIVGEGFKNSITRHNLIYGKLIGDGDSSVYKHLVEIAPYGPSFYIKKIECRNHLLRNFINKLSDLSKDTKYSKPHREYVSNPSMLGRFRNAVIRAIAYRKSENNALDDKIDNLKKDILNSPYHIFGRHVHCKDYFCKGSDENKDDLVDIYTQNGILGGINTIIQRLADHASSLLYDTDNNPAETYNSIIAKLVGGKRINFSLKNSYQLRCELAAISYNCKQRNLLGVLHKQLCGRPPGHYTQIFLDAQLHRYNNRSRKHHIKKRAFQTADQHYGMVEEIAIPDLSLEEYELKSAQFLKDLKNLNRRDVERDTINQSKSDLWIIERKKRITASNFGKVCKLRKTTSTAKTVTHLLYSSFRGNKYTQFGLESEVNAIEHFERLYQVKVTRCGLIVDEEKPYLACSPDGLVGEDSIVEIKSSLKSGDHDPVEACMLKLIDYCVLDEENNRIMLKRSHNYYYQLQGIMHITKRSNCYFIVYTTAGIHVEEIRRDDIFWTQHMEKKLQEFYMQSLLPELVDSRRCRNMDIRTVHMVN